VFGIAELLIVAPGACIERLVVADTTRGPVLIDQQAVVQSFSRLEGPCYVGPNTHVRGARIRASSIGPHCRVGGEIEASVIQGFSNKAHDGFLGHSYLGTWVNLGSGTQVADLRTDYRNVTVAVGDEPTDSGVLKLGALIGDHTKTGIGTLLNAGTVVGAFAQLLPDGGLLAHSIPSFCRCRNGRLEERTDLRKLFAAARVSFERRGCVWTEAHQEFYFDLYERTLGRRRQVMEGQPQCCLRQVV